MDSAVNALTLGIEEEYLLVDPQTGDLARDPPKGLLAACEAACDPDAGAVSPEFMRAQIEVGTSICQSGAKAAGWNASPTGSLNVLTSMACSVTFVDK